MEWEFEDHDHTPSRVEAVRKDLATLQDIQKVIAGALKQVREIGQQLDDWHIIDEIEAGVNDAVADTIGRSENAMADYVDDYDAMIESAARFRDRAAHLDRVL